tara:strand:- start:165 stop:668 length:504 start_codon:yes stop_codon:yes gene_type:complete
MASEIRGSDNFDSSEVGKVLQVVSTTSATGFTTTATSLTNTGVELAITPTLSTSKILVLITTSIGGTPSSNPAVGIRRDSTDIALGTAGGSRRAATGSILAASSTHSTISIGLSHLDAPATTALTTYRITLSARSGYTVSINRSSSDADAIYVVRPVTTITLMEIGA